MRRLWFLIALLAIIVCAPAQKAEAQFGFGFGYGGFGYGVQGGYGAAAWTPSPTPLYNGIQNSGAIFPNGRVEGFGFTAPGVGYVPQPVQFIPPQPQYIPPRQFSRQDVIPLQRAEEQRRLQQQQQLVPPPPVDNSPGPVPDPSLQNILQQRRQEAPRPRIASWRHRNR